MQLVLLKEPLCPPVVHPYLSNKETDEPTPGTSGASSKCDTMQHVNDSPSSTVAVSTQYENITTDNNNVADENDNEQKCRICKRGGESEEWVGCDKESENGESCEYWVHLSSCLGIKLKSNKGLKTFIKKFDFLCPNHR